LRPRVIDEPRQAPPAWRGSRISASAISRSAGPPLLIARCRPGTKVGLPLPPQLWGSWWWRGSSPRPRSMSLVAGCAAPGGGDHLDEVTMIDFGTAKILSHRRNIQRCVMLLATELTELERQYLHERIAEERAESGATNGDSIRSSGSSYRSRDPLNKKAHAEACHAPTKSARSSRRRLALVCRTTRFASSLCRSARASQSMLKRCARRFAQSSMAAWRLAVANAFGTTFRRAVLVPEVVLCGLDPPGLLKWRTCARLCWARARQARAPRLRFFSFPVRPPGGGKAASER